MSMSMRYVSDKKTPILVFLIVALISISLIMLLHKARIDDWEKNTHQVGGTYAYSIEKQLAKSLSATISLASIVHNVGGEIEDFDEIAESMIKLYGGISSLQLAPKGVVQKIYPLKGNEKAIGHDLLKDPKRREEAMKAIQSKKLTLAGPVNLIQGGWATIGRYPVFLHSGTDVDEQFWGFTIVLIRLDKLIKDVGVYDLIREGYNFKLSKVPSSGEPVIFLKSPNGEIKRWYDFTIKVPNGNWQLSLSPKKAAYSNIFSIVLWLVGFLVTISITFLTNLLVVYMKKLRDSNTELNIALDEIKTLSGILPICSSCKKIRDEKGSWVAVESYVTNHTEAEFTHGICPACSSKLYPDLEDE